MRYLLDTHIILCWLTEPDKIGSKAYQIISDKSNHLFLSSASFWEMAIKQSLGRLTVPQNLIETLTAERFQILPITAEEGLGIVDLPLYHNDPFDRLLIIQAKFHDLILITNDAKIKEYPVITLEG